MRLAEDQERAAAGAGHTGRANGRRGRGGDDDDDDEEDGYSDGDGDEDDGEGSSGDGSEDSEGDEEDDGGSARRRSGGAAGPSGRDGGGSKAERRAKAKKAAAAAAAYGDAVVEEGRYRDPGLYISHVRDERQRDEAFDAETRAAELQAAVLDLTAEDQQGGLGSSSKGVEARERSVRSEMVGCRYVAVYNICVVASKGLSWNGRSQECWEYGTESCAFCNPALVLCQSPHRLP